MSEAEQRPHRTVALLRKSHSPGWIWAIPIAALIIVGWLLVRELAEGGTDVIVTFREADGLSDQSDVRLRGVKVGTVTRVELSKDQKIVIAHLNIDDAARSDLNAGTSFYLANASPSLSDLASLKSVFSGPAIVIVPGRGKPATRFAGVIGDPPKPIPGAVRYMVDFTGNVGAVRPGSKISFFGFDVGEVIGTELTTDLRTGRVSDPVVIALDPAAFHIAGADGNDASSLSALLAVLVRNGLRAELTQNPPLIGAQSVTLKMVDNAPPEDISTAGPYPRIPSDEAGGGVMALVSKLGQIPIGQIGENVNAITAHVAKLVDSPELSDSIAQLDHTLTELDSVVHKAGPDIAPMIADLRKTADKIDATAQSAQRIVGGSVASNGNLQQSLLELTDAARAIRSLADYIDEHPESLLRGR